MFNVLFSMRGSSFKKLLKLIKVGWNKKLGVSDMDMHCPSYDTLGIVNALRLEMDNTSNINPLAKTCGKTALRD